MSTKAMRKIQCKYRIQHPAELWFKQEGILDTLQVCKTLAGFLYLENYSGNSDKK